MSSPHGETIDELTIRLRKESLRIYYRNNPAALAILAGQKNGTFLYWNLKSIIQATERRLRNGGAVDKSSDQPTVAS